MPKNPLVRTLMVSQHVKESETLHIDIQWEIFSFCKNECFMQPIQMHLSSNQKIFDQLCSAFSKSKLNLDLSEKKDDTQRLFVSKIIDCKRLFSLNA